MCGIVGIISRQPNGFWKAHSDLFTNFVRIDSIRGTDSTGVFGVSSSGKVDIVKGNADGYIFTCSDPYTKFSDKMYRKFRIAIGHNRAATRGKVVPENAHPFHEGNIVLVHNGTIFNSEDLNKEADVDSHAIAHALNDHNAVEALGKLNGAFALVWYNTEDKTLNLARNKERPLFLVNTEDNWILSSESGLALWLLGRSSIKVNKIELVPSEKILSFELDKLAQQPIETSFEEYKAPESRWKSYLPQTYKEEPDTPIFEKPRLRFSAKAGELKVGDNIKVVFQDYKDEQSGKAYQLFLGHPVFGNEIDSNISIQAYIMKERVTDFIGLCNTHEYFMAKITGIGNYKNVPLVYVSNPEPITQRTTLNQETFDSAVLAQILAPGCPRCNSSIPLEDAQDTIIKQKANGGYRVVCKKCIAASMEKAGVQELTYVQ